LHNRDEIATSLKNTEGNTTLQIAKMRKNDEVVRLLKEAGAAE
jgi:ankyrin repeat protein